MKLQPIAHHLLQLCLCCLDSKLWSLRGILQQQQQQQ
jgi:hypothetical protein